MNVCGPIYSPWVSEEGFKSSKENVGLSGELQTESSLESQPDDQNRKNVITISDEYFIEQVTTDKKFNKKLISLYFIIENFNRLYSCSFNP